MERPTSLPGLWLEDLRDRLLSLFIVLEERLGENEVRLMHEFH